MRTLEIREKTLWFYQERVNAKMSLWENWPIRIQEIVLNGSPFLVKIVKNHQKDSEVDEFNNLLLHKKCLGFIRKDSSTCYVLHDFVVNFWHTKTNFKVENLQKKAPLYPNKSKYVQLSRGIVLAHWSFFLRWRNFSRTYFSSWL